jgi:hypothetical protein
MEGGGRREGKRERDIRRDSRRGIPKSKEHIRSTTKDAQRHTHNPHPQRKSRHLWIVDVRYGCSDLSSRTVSISAAYIHPKNHQIKWGGERRRGKTKGPKERRSEGNRERNTNLRVWRILLLLPRNTHLIKIKLHFNTPTPIQTIQITTRIPFQISSMPPSMSPTPRTKSKFPIEFIKRTPTRTPSAAPSPPRSTPTSPSNTRFGCMRNFRPRLGTPPKRQIRRPRSLRFRRFSE